MVYEMDRICQYSTIIFAGNMSVLLFVSIMTDYWEYRGFNQDYVIKKIAEIDEAEIDYLEHTNTCFIMRHWYNREKPNVPINITSVNQPPAILHQYRYLDNVSVTHYSFNGTHNVSVQTKEEQLFKYKDELVMYTEYGNLFRNCDDLEGRIILFDSSLYGIRKVSSWTLP